jgi:hypothetical protein
MYRDPYCMRCMVMACWVMGDDRTFSFRATTARSSLQYSTVVSCIIEIRMWNV